MDISSLEFQEALRDHAKSLHVDPDTESYLIPFVQEALFAELPLDWEQGETEDGTLYYYNTTTEESIWEHPLDGYYRDLIQTKKSEYRPNATISTTSIDTYVPTTAAAPATSDVYSFDALNDDDLPPSAASAHDSDLVVTSIPPTPSSKINNSTRLLAIETQSSTPIVSTVDSTFGRDRSWLLDDDDNVAPIALQSFKVNEISRLEPRQTSYTAMPTSPIPIDIINPPLNTPLPQNNPSLSSRRSKTASDPLVAKIQQLEQQIVDALNDLNRERVDHADTTMQLQTARQEAQENTYLKMKVNELKTKLGDAEQTAASRQMEKLAELEAENARLVKLQGQTLRETQARDAQHLQHALESKEKEIEQLKTRLEEQEQELKAASQAHATEAAALLEKLELQAHALKVTAEERSIKCREFDTVQQELEALKAIADDQTLKNETLERELHTLQAKADTSEQLDKVQEALAKQETFSREMEITNRDLQMKLDRLQQEKTQIIQKNEALTHELETKRSELTTLEAVLVQTRDELCKVRAQYEKDIETQRQTHHQTALERERVTMERMSQAQAQSERLQVQLDEMSMEKAYLQSEERKVRRELANVLAQKVKPLENLRDQLQRELAMQTDRANQFEMELDVLVRREQQQKTQMEAFKTAKLTLEKQLASLQDELLIVQTDKRVEIDKLQFRLRELETHGSQKEYEAARVTERLAKAEAWRVNEAARVDKRDVQVLELREQLTALQARHVELETNVEVQELRAVKQKMEGKVQKLERELHEERDVRKREEIRWTEEMQRMQQTVEWQLPQLAQACVTRSSDEWAKKYRTMAKKLRDELNMRAFQERNELVSREHQAREACERAEQKLKTVIAESEFQRRELGRLEDTNKVLLEQLHTIRVYLMQRPIPSHVTRGGFPAWTWPGENSPTSTQSIPSATSGGGGNISDFSTVNHLNTQLGILHAQFQQFFDFTERPRAPTLAKNCFKIPSCPQMSTSQPSKSMKPSLSNKIDRKQVEKKQREDEDAKMERLAMDALMDEKLAACTFSKMEVDCHPSPFQRQQEDLLLTLESLGQARWLPSDTTDKDDGLEELEEPHSILWYQQDYWRRKYQ